MRVWVAFTVYYYMHYWWSMDVWRATFSLSCLEGAFWVYGEGKGRALLYGVALLSNLGAGAECGFGMYIQE